MNTKKIQTITRCLGQGTLSKRRMTDQIPKGLTVLIMSMLLNATSAFGAGTNTWLGNIGNSWGFLFDWSRGRLPTTSETVLIAQTPSPSPPALPTDDYTIRIGADREVAAFHLNLTQKDLLIDDSAFTLTFSDLTQVKTSGGNQTTIEPDVALSANADWQIDSGSRVRVLGDLSGAFRLRKLDDGDLFLYGNNNAYAGELRILGGVVRTYGGDALSDSALVRVDAGGVLDIRASEKVGALNGAGSVELNSNYLGIKGDQTQSFSGNLAGDGSSELIHSGTGILNLTGSNTFMGLCTISRGAVRISHTNALKSAMVAIEEDDGLDITTAALDVNIAALSGSGRLDLGAQKLTVGSKSVSTIYSGVLAGATNSILNHDSVGTLTLTGGNAGTPSSFGRLHALDGLLMVDGARINLNSDRRGYSRAALFVKGGDITLTNGADVRVTGTAEGRGTIDGDSTLTLSGAGTVLTCNELFAGDNSSETGHILVQNEALLKATTTISLGNAGVGSLIVKGGATVNSERNLIAGNTGAGSILVTGSGSMIVCSNGLHLGGSGGSGDPSNLLIENNAIVQAGGISIRSTNSSVNVDGGTLSAGNMNSANSTTMNISDPAGGPALLCGGGSISGTISGPGSLTQTGTNILYFHTANTYSGDTTIEEGTLRLHHDGSIANSKLILHENSELVVQYNDSATIGALEGAGIVSLVGGDLVTGGNGLDTTFSGVILGSQYTAFTHAGAGILTLSGGAETPTSTAASITSRNGGTIVADGIRLNLSTHVAGAKAMEAGVGGSIILTNQADVQLTNNGSIAIGNGSLTVTGEGTSLAGSGGVVVETPSSRFTVEHGASVRLVKASTLYNGITTVRSGASLAIENTIFFCVGPNKTGVVFQVSGTNSQVSCGWLQMGRNTSSGDVIVEDGAVMQVAIFTKLFDPATRLIVDAGWFETDRLLDDKESSGGMGTINISDAVVGGRSALTIGTKDFSGSPGGDKFGGLIQDAASGPGSILKIGRRKLAINGANTYSGGTFLTNGLIEVMNTNGSALGSGAVMAMHESTLMGNGSVSGAISIDATSTIEPGTSVGVFTAGSNLTINGTFLCEIDGATADVVNVVGDLDISNATLDIDVLSGGVTASNYVIAVYGTLTGAAFASTTNLPTNYELDYAYNGNQIALVQKTPYEFWAISYGLSGTNALFDADSDGDGGKNGYEWATGTNPTNPASITMLGISSTNTDAVVSFTRNTNATDVAIELQRSLNLVSNVWNGIATNTAGSWNPPGIVTETGSGNPVDVEITNSHTNQPAANYRLLVE